ITPCGVGHVIVSGGFQNFRLQFPQQCESEHSTSGICGMSCRLSASISQPCLSHSANDGPTQIFPFMYLGSQNDAANTEQMKKRGITHVVNLSIGCPRASSITSDENFLRIPVNDSYQEKLSPYFERAWEFLERVRKSGNVVLIHCLAGISRSPTLAISYVMRYLNMSSEDAYKLVKEKRPSISPNFNFMGQLLEYEQLLIRNGLLSVEASSKRDTDTVVCPASKVPKSASTHCVFFEKSREIGSTSVRVNENGKRGLSDSLDRPKVLGLYKDSKRLSAEELPSPSTELSKLTFVGLPSPSSSASGGELQNLSISNPCFLSPTRETLQPERRTEECETSRRSFFKHRIVSLFKVSML
uniref:protein-tyrosine-phosphatase n=1 Tax=Angiostrongylus cantonensis TaxID=6313 RepID=A0A0K0DIT2_ANGCA